jgi:hypothetical protein
MFQLAHGVISFESRFVVATITKVRTMLAIKDRFGSVTMDDAIGPNPKRIAIARDTSNRAAGTAPAAMDHYRG